jgi:hypothetical protein|tara:strand:- start:220 stop:522 length:303 start_codon:yes stop_codon:yes gene_type:complete
MAKSNARKTVNVGAVLYNLNYFLKKSKCSPDEREVMCIFVEGILFDTGNYEGFRYLDGREYEGEAEGLGTRRFYFVSSKIVEDYNAAEAMVAKDCFGRGI